MKKARLLDKQLANEKGYQLWKRDSRKRKPNGTFGFTTLIHSISFLSRHLVEIYLAGLGKGVRTL